MRNYSTGVKILAICLILIENVVLLGGLGYIAYSKYKEKILGASISRIDKKNVIIHPADTLKHFYEWDAHQIIRHERTWLPHPVVAKTNSDGIIGAEDYSSEKSEGTFRVLALGD